MVCLIIWGGVGMSPLPLTPLVSEANECIIF